MDKQAISNKIRHQQIYKRHYPLKIMKGDAKKRGPKPKSSSTTSRHDKNLEKILIENFISMQKVMTGLAVKFDHLTKQVENLLDLFEDSAKTLTEKEINLELKGDTEKQEEVLEGLRKLLDQNKLIAKGITLMHDAATNPQQEYVVGTVEQPQQISNQIPKPMPQMGQSQMTPSEPMQQPNSFNTPEVTSPVKKPKVMEEQSPEPNFQI